MKESQTGQEITTSDKTKGEIVADDDRTAKKRPGNSRKVVIVGAGDVGASDELQALHASASVIKKKFDRINDL
ncbi:MAG: hypothetical protein JW913_16710 [Chitinispirillaceae bacterium]|nr:hypothetical protein [Chitinispirillaceae bacterium]